MFQGLEPECTLLDGSPGMAASQTILKALDQLKYPCQYDTRALEALEKKVGVKRPRSAPPARRPELVKAPTIAQVTDLETDQAVW